MALLRTYSFNSGTTNRGMKSTATVLSHRLLTALHAIDPMSYLFAYRSEASNKLVVLPTPLDAAGIINGDNEPRVPRSRLDPIWRRTGTSVPESENGPQEAQVRLAACACTPPPP